MVVLDIDFGLDCQSTANHYHGIDFPVVQRMVTLDIDFDLDCRSIANHYREFLGVDFGIDILRRMVALDTDFGLDCRSTANHYRETHGIGFVGNKVTLGFLGRMMNLDIDFGLNCRSTANHYRETHIDHHNHTHYCKTHRHMSYYYNDCIHGFRSSPSYLDSSLIRDPSFESGKLVTMFRQSCAVGHDCFGGYVFVLLEDMASNTVSNLSSYEEVLVLPVYAVISFNKFDHPDLVKKAPGLFPFLISLTHKSKNLTNNQSRGRRPIKWESDGDGGINPRASLTENGGINSNNGELDVDSKSTEAENQGAGVKRKNEKAGGRVTGKEKSDGDGSNPQASLTVGLESMEVNQDGGGGSKRPRYWGRRWIHNPHALPYPTSLDTLN
ncbi:hypothetical protein LXL04_012900 [Taraxacum kok-saghyz]